MLKATIVIGNPKPKSRTLKVVESLSDRLFDGTEVDLQIIDLVDHVGDLFKWPSDAMSELTARVAGSDIAFFACPTYKASYTGLLKAFLDRYPAQGLQGVTAVCLMTGADATHSLAPTVHLVPLLMELGASVPMPGLYFNTTQIDRLDQFTEQSASSARAVLERLMAIGNSLAPAK